MQVVHIYRCLEVTWRSVEIRPSVSENLCDFMRRCGGYHNRDIRKRNIPNVRKAARMVSILVLISVTNSFVSQPPYCFSNITIRVIKCFLAIHHSRSSFPLKYFYQFCCNYSHNVLRFSIKDITS